MPERTPFVTNSVDKWRVPACNEGLHRNSTTCLVALCVNILNDAEHMLKISGFRLICIIYPRPFFLFLASIHDF